MIVREHENEFIMIEQADHSVISGDCFANWKLELLKGAEFADAVRYAITNHDFGWHDFDKMPFWNDVTEAPYNFMDFPVIPKLVFYKNGVDELENLNPYAGMLASRHYSHLSIGDSDWEEAKEFIKFEQERRERLENNITDFNSDLFEFHYATLAVCDNFSLYVCLNEPGSTKQDEHPLFKEGFPIPAALDLFKEKKFSMKWLCNDEVKISPFPFNNETNVTLKQRTVSKNSIKQDGLIKSYMDAPVREISITFVP